MVSEATWYFVKHKFPRRLFLDICVAESKDAILYIALVIFMTFKQCGLIVSLAMINFLL